MNLCNWNGTSIDLNLDNRADLTVYYADTYFVDRIRYYPLVNWVYRKKCEIHTWVCSSSTEATCKDSGLAKYECSVCGATKKEILPVKDVHVWGSWITTKNASCTEQGEKERICSVCQKKQTSVTPVLGHNMGAWTVTKNATALNKGEKQQQCTRCSYVKKSSIPKLTPTITVNAAALSLKCGQTTTALKVTGLAEGDSVASWKSSDTSVFTVSGKPNGTCTITAGKQAKKTAKLTITLKSGLTKEIEISTQKKAVKTTKITGVASKLTLKKGKTQTLKPILSPITSTEKIKFSSSNEKVATVTSGGKIKAVAAGKAVITVKAGSKSVKVTVIVPGIGNLKSSVTVKKGKNLTLSPKIYGISEKVTYISSNRKVATVTAKGKIKGIKKGSAKITVQAGSYKKTVKVTVK